MPQYVAWPAQKCLAVKFQGFSWHTPIQQVARVETIGAGANSLWILSYKPCKIGLALQPFQSACNFFTKIGCLGYILGVGVVASRGDRGKGLFIPTEVMDRGQSGDPYPKLVVQHEMIGGI